MISLARKGAMFISNMTRPSGKLIYEFNIKSGKSYPKYNMLRHFGCIYAMLEILQYASKEEVPILKESSRKALQWAMKKKIIEIDNNFAILEKDKIKIGANALAILAFGKWYQLFGDTELFGGYFASQILRKLCTYLLNQVKDNGELKFYKLDYKTGKPDDFISNFYPGEIMLAFCMMSKLVAEIEESVLINSALNIMHWLRDHRDRYEQTRDHWQLQSLAMLYNNQLVSKQEKEHIKKYAKRIAKVEPITPERFVNVPSGPIAARTEGLMAYYKINPEKWTLKEIEKNIKRLARFQIKSGTYKGCFKYKLHDDITRIDHNQHGSIALFEYWKIKERK